MTGSRTILTLLAVASLTLIGAAPPHHLAPCLHSQFKDITQTLADGTVVGEPDPHDWGCVGGGSSSDDARLAGPRQRVARPSALDVPPAPPPALCMEPAAPNPATSATRLQFALPAAAQVSLVVHARQHGHESDASVVRTLFDGQLQAGFFTFVWDLKDDLGVRVAPGIYRAVLVVGDEALCGDIEVP